MPKQFYSEAEYVLHEAMEYDELFSHFVFLDQEAFDGVRDFINRMSAAFNDAQDEREHSQEGN